MIRLTTPLTADQTVGLKAGDSVLITGTVYTARDAAHKRLVDLADKGEALPIDVKDAIIYYVGPAPAKPGAVLGSAGPTTSYRMDAYAPTLINMGLKGMIGKGLRNSDVVNAMTENKAVYFGAIGGAGALLAKCVKSAEIVAYEDLGAEAIRKLEVVDLPVVVIIDTEGNNLYKTGQEGYLETLNK